MLLLTSWLSDQFDLGWSVDGFWTALWASIVVSIVSFVLNAFIPDRDDERRQRPDLTAARPGRLRLLGQHLPLADGRAGGRAIWPRAGPDRGRVHQRGDQSRGARRTDRPAGRGGAARARLSRRRPSGPPDHPGGDRERRPGDRHGGHPRHPHDGPGAGGPATSACSPTTTLPPQPGSGVPDPWYGTADGFYDTLTAVEAAMPGRSRPRPRAPEGIRKLLPRSGRIAGCSIEQRVKAPTRGASAPRRSSNVHHPHRDRRHRAGRDCTPAQRVTRSLLGYGVLAGPFYVITSVVQALAHDGFDLTRHAWSQLAAGPQGWIQMANLMLTGAMVVAFAVGLRRSLPQPLGAAAGRHVRARTDRGGSAGGGPGRRLPGGHARPGRADRPRDRSLRGRRDRFRRPDRGRLRPRPGLRPLGRPPPGLVVPAHRRSASPRRSSGSAAARPARASSCPSWPRSSPPGRGWPGSRCTSTGPSTSSS